ncbi:ribose 5-phosphate isomerase B [Halanaerobacter jeridensis]|uniref:Ribose 5-phosphate isomerase B n=1 Tax=Halanaerobacter jeridensis TaxID=706427 RepID=A0A938XTZ7_9FIRM|nr:ribose 5-phosphate isomerase B [Halanaerobacter jeridensis]MBM7556864.1 ribose 5-phosphate isomerase B [Halanaerobacter jeridensis]
MIAIGADHAGFKLKELIKDYFDRKQIVYQDFGTFDDERVDSVDIAKTVCEKIRNEDYNKGILICGTGIGMSITANKIPGIRAALVENVYSARTSKRHNDANVICIGARVSGFSLVKEMINCWLQADFDAQTRRIRRKNKIQSLEQEYNKEEFIMSKFKVMVTDYEYETLEYEEKILKEIDAEFLKAQARTQEEVIEAAPKDVDGLLVQYAQIGEEVFKALPQLKVVARYGIGVDTVDLEAATDHGVNVVNVAEYCQDEVSDQALSLLLACARKTVLLNNDVKSGNWDFSIAKPIYRLRDRTLGIVGFGKIPRKLADKATALGLELLVHDPFVEKEVTEKYDVELVELDKLMKKSDFISIHVPLNENTKHMISTKEFELMKESSFIINTARGAVIDEEALIAALKDNELAGAALDVTEQEPITKDNPLLEMDNVIITPHVGWYSEDAQIELQTRAAEGVADVLMGNKPKYLVNQEVLEK